MTAIWAGGLENFVLNLSSRLDPRIFSTTIYSWTGDDNWDEIFLREGLPVVKIGGPKRIRGPLDACRFVLAWLRLRNRLKADRIDIVHTHDFLPSLLGRTASIAAGVPHRVVTLHNLYDWWPNWVYPVNRILARNTQGITCVSESVRQFMLQRERLPPERYRTVLNGVDETRFRPDPKARETTRKELGIGDNDILVGSVGSITTRKAQWILAEAIAPLIRDGLRIQVRIWGANTDNPQHAESELLERIASLGIADRFRILPARKDIQNIYNAMDIHCMTSVAEGLSLASVEALMCGIYPIYSDIGPFQEVVDPSVGGALFRSGQPVDLERVLRQTLADNEFRARSFAIRADSVRRFSLDRLASEYTALYLGTRHVTR